MAWYPASSNRTSRVPFISVSFATAEIADHAERRQQDPLRFAGWSGPIPPAGTRRRRRRRRSGRPFLASVVVSGGNGGPLPLPLANAPQAEPEAAGPITWHRPRQRPQLRGAAVAARGLPQGHGTQEARRAEGGAPARSPANADAIALGAGPQARSRRFPWPALFGTSERRHAHYHSHRTDPRRRPRWV